MMLDAGENPSTPMMVAGVSFTPWIMFAERSLTPKEMVARLRTVQIPYLKSVLQITPPAWVANQTEASFAPHHDPHRGVARLGAQAPRHRSRAAQARRQGPQRAMKARFASQFPSVSSPLLRSSISDRR